MDTLKIAIIVLAVILFFNCECSCQNGTEGFVGDLYHFDHVRQDTSVTDTSDKDITEPQQHLSDGLYTITTAVNNDQEGTDEKCLIMPAEGNGSYPETYVWDNDTMRQIIDYEYRDTVRHTCGFPNRHELLENGQGVWRLTNIKDDLYTLTNDSGHYGEMCLAFNSNADDRYPMRRVWNNEMDPFMVQHTCGFNTRSDLLKDGSAVFRITPINKDNLYTITNTGGTFINKEEKYLGFYGLDKAHPHRNRRFDTTSLWRFNRIGD